MQISCTGLNHATADVSLRERVALDASGVRRALASLKDAWEPAEFVVVSTCNRTEIYTGGADRPDSGQIAAWMEKFCNVEPGELDESIYVLDGREAAGHLFAVAAGMDSMVPGEGQIRGQLKDAYAAALDAGAADGLMNELFQEAFRAARRIRSETGVGSGKVSVASVAVEFVRRVFESLDDKCVLSVGAGKMNRIMLRHLAKFSPGWIVVVGRTPDHTRRLSDEFGASSATLEQLDERMDDADVVLCSTAARGHVISAEMIRAAQRRRNYRPMIIVDIAVPRDVDPNAADVENVFLYDIDDLKKIVAETLAMRRSQDDRAEKIISHHVEELSENLRMGSAGPLIGKIYGRMERIAAEELADAENKLSTHEDAEEDVEILRRALHRTIRRILHRPTSKLRNLASKNEADEYIRALRKLFDLDE